MTDESQTEAVHEDASNLTSDDNSSDVAQEITQEQSAETPIENEEQTKQSGFDKRINRLTAKAKAAEDRARFLEAQLQAQRYQPQAVHQAPPIDHSAPIEPNENDFDDPKVFAKKYAQWVKEDLSYKASQQQRAQSQSQREQYLQNIGKGYQKQLNEMHHKYDDFQDALDVVDSFQLDMNDPRIAELAYSVMEMPNAGEIVYYLGNNPDEYETLLAKPLKSALVHLGKIDAKVSNKVDQKIVSKNAPPSQKVKSNATLAASQKRDFNDLRKRLRNR